MRDVKTFAVTVLFALTPQLAAQQTLAVPGRIVLVRTSADTIADSRRYVQALSASALVGLPLAMFVEAELRPLQRDLLAHLPGVEVVCVGEAPDLGGRASRSVASAAELFEPGPEAVLTTVHSHDQLAAVAEACRRRLPLLILDSTIGDQLQRLGTKKIWCVAPHLGEFLLADVEIERIDPTAARLAQLRGSEAPYLAVANVGAARSYVSGTPLGVAALAAARGGVVHLVDQKVEFDYATLRKRFPPAGLEDHPTEDWLVGAFEIDGRKRNVAVPRVGSGPGIRGVTPRWGDPVVDLDGDGRLDEETETVPVGDVRRIGERDWSISVRLVGAIGQTKFRDGMRVERAVRIAPAAETVAAELTALYAEAGVIPRHLVIAGDHREVPFDYCKDPVYAESMMHEQELASDNLYADPDNDGYLDIAVGRFVAADRVQATSLAARIVSRPHWQNTEPPAAALIYPAWAKDEIELQSPMIFPSFEAFQRGVAADVGHAGYEPKLHLREDGDLAPTLESLPTCSLVVFTHHSGPDGWQFRIHKQDGQWQTDALIPRGHVADGRPGTAVPFLLGAPLIVGAGCDSAGLDYEVVFESSIVHTFFERGALGYVGNTRAGFPDTEEFLLRQMLQAALGMQAGGDGPQSIGEAFRQAKNHFDLLIRERGPFRCVEPFERYDLAMRREWTSLVYYGDPAFRLPATAKGPTVEVRVAADCKTIDVRCDAEVAATKIWFMQVVGVGPLEEVAALVVPGLSYSSVPWATYADTAQPAIVGPGIYLDLPLPAAVSADSVTLREGPAWAMGGSRVVTDARGGRRLLLSIDLLRYAMAAPDGAERARHVVVELK